jgi:hypothetical protein
VKVRERENIEAEHDRLRREVDALRAEHATLERKPVDTAEHSAGVASPSEREGCVYQYGCLVLRLV